MGAIFSAAALMWFIFGLLAAYAWSKFKPGPQGP